MLFVFHPKILLKHCFQFLFGVKIVPRDTEDNAYAKFWGDKQNFCMLWYFWSGQYKLDHAKVLLCNHPSPMMDKNQSDLKALEKSRLGLVFLHWLRTRREIFLPKVKCNNSDPKQ